MYFLFQKINKIFKKAIFSSYFLPAYLLYLFVALVGLWVLTKSWLPPGFALVGHDSGLAPDAKEFLQTRFYAWDQQGFGLDNSTHFGSIILHFFDYILSLVAGVPYAGSHVAIFFWLSTLFITSFIFAYNIRNKLGNIFPFLFPVFITFNFFIFQSIFILERAKYSVFVALLFFLVIVLKLLEDKLSVLVAAIFTSFVFFLFNSGSWLGLPLYGSLITTVGALILFMFLDGKRARSFSTLGRLLVFLLLTIIGSILLNSYSIWPYLVTFVTRDYLSLLDWGVITSNKAWLDSISNATSFLNIFRLQGIPDWYAGASSPNLAHPYAREYSTNLLLIVASFAFPVLAFSSLLLMKKKEEKQIVVFFSLLALISMFFMAGTHPPLGFFYEALYDFIPGFSIFRSPYFKFGSGFILAISVLMAFSLSVLIGFVSRRFTTLLQKFSVSIFLIGFSLFLWFAFHYPLLDSMKVFSWQEGLTTKVKPPDYIYKFKDWSITENKNNKRILLLPPLNQDWQNDSYEWGYWSLSTLPSVLTPRSTIANDRLLLNEEREWINMLYAKLRDEDETGMLDLVRRLGIGYFLIRKDVVDDLSWSSTDSPEVYESVLEKFASVKKIKTFDKWLVYEIEKNQLDEKIFAIPSLKVVPLEHAYLGREFLRSDHFYLLDDKDEPGELANLFSKKTDVYTCHSCLLERKDALTSLPGVQILPNSVFYYFKILREKETIRKTTTEQSKADAYLGFTLIRTGEVKTMLDTGIDERYVIQDLETMNKYLKNYYELLQIFSNPATDYDRARHLLDVVNPIEKYLREYVAGNEFGRQSEKFRQEILNALWQIYTIKNYFSPLYGDREILEKEKIYFAKLREPGDYGLFLSVSSLPIGNDGKPVLPYLVEYLKGEEKVALELTDEKKGWIEIKFPPQEEGEIQIRLKFHEPPNIFEITGSDLQQSPTGTRACYYGKINSFRKGKKYNVIVKVSNKNQSLRMFFQESTLTRDRNGFIRGEDEIDILPIVGYEPFRYLYYPSGYAKEPVVYLCSGNKQFPVLDEIAVHEIFSPLLVSTKDIPLLSHELPGVTFKQVNATKYSIKIEDAVAQFVLFFNERYSPFWKLSSSSTFGNSSGLKHFPVDGYANAWFIEGKGDFELTLEYSLQNYFYAGSAMTAFSIIGLSITFVYMVIKKKRHV